MTIEDYLKGAVGISIPDETLNMLLADASVESGSEVSSLETKVVELLKANLYVWCASSPSTFGSVSDTNGVWSHKESGATISTADRSMWIRLANEIFRKYGVKTVGSSIKLNSYGIRLWKQGL